MIARSRAIHTLLEAGIDDARQAAYQWKMSTLFGRGKDVMTALMKPRGSPVSTDLTLAQRQSQTGLRLLEQADAVMEANREILDAVRDALTAAAGLIERGQRRRGGQLQVLGGRRA